jgi:hypothetical protein
MLIEHKMAVMAKFHHRRHPPVIRSLLGLALSGKSQFAL